MANCFKNWLACMRACSRLPGTADQIVCALDCDLELAKCVKNELLMSSATEAVAVSRSMRLGLSLPIELLVYDGDTEVTDKHKKSSKR